MQKCVNCGHENRPGVMYCENCGVSLAGSEAPLDTKSIDESSEEEKAKLGVEESVLIDVRVEGSATFGENDLLRLDIEGSSEPIIIKPEAETIFGRRDPATGAMPDVDLTPFAGYRMGVSRRHAAIRFGDERVLNLWDLGSSNGTYLNGERLNAHRPYRVHNGDELRLGQMLIRLHFQAPSSAPQPPGEKTEKDAWVEAEEEQPAGASPAKPVESGANAKKAPADSVEKRAGSPLGKPSDESKPIELGPPKEQPNKPADSADRSDGVITLPPITDIIQRPTIKIEDPEEKPDEKPEEKAEEEVEEEPEVPTTRPIDDEQRDELGAQAAPVSADDQKPETTEQKSEVTDQKPGTTEQKPEADSDQKSEADSDQKREPDSAAPPAKPENESQDKEKRD
jgi:pSer/pThr/pTyr-binding forkhead associated (FHA) protein